MEEKLQRVTLCLKKIYGNQPIPQYKVNARIANILYELVECNESRDRDVSLLIEDMKQKATQYEAEANSLQGLLTESLDLSLSSLSSEGTSYLNVLVNSAMTLETKDTSLARDLKKTEELLEVEKAKADSRSQNLKFLKDKSEDLKIRIKAAEVGCPRRVLIYDKYKDPFSSFTENCISSDYLVLIVRSSLLTHESLVSLSEKLAGLQEEMVPLKKKLESYLDLTPLIIFSTVLLYLLSD
ncbi:HAUS augmin-like complex subunit 1 [Chlamydotis macqueenii]